MWQYYNANPLGRKVSDCAVRAISLATEQTWDDTYIMLSEYGRQQGITFSEVEFINDFYLNVMNDIVRREKRKR